MIDRFPVLKPHFRKLVLLCSALLLLVGFSFLLSGCGQDDSEQRIAELEAEVKQLQEEQSGSSDQSSSDASQDQTSESESYSDSTVQDFSDRADELISKAEATEVPSDRDSRVDAFFDLDSEFNALESEIDAYEDQKESEYRSGSLSWDEYRTLEVQLEGIEDRLDNAQDQLEYRFGIDD